MNWYSLTVVLLVSVCASQALKVSYEFEDALTEEQYNDTAAAHWRWRGVASEAKTLRIADENGQSYISFTLCLNKLVNFLPMTLRIDNITYTNDGPKDEVNVTLDGASVGNWKTYEICGSGFQWNVARFSGQVGSSMALPDGNHTLKLAVRTDEYGTELDKIDITLTNQRPDQDVFCAANVVFG